MGDSTPGRTGVLIGGSGLIGGTLLHHFKHNEPAWPHLIAPNSKELSLRVPSDIRSFFERVEPDFIVNCAIAAIGSDPQLTFEVNCMGTVHLARVARELGIPYVHFSSGAVLPSGRDLGEDVRLPLGADLSNYAKGKILAETALEHLHRTQGLDYTNIRLGIVYGAHDHKIQGFHHLLFSLVSESMPVLFTSRDSAHSYTNAEKLPAFVAHVLERREEFGGQTFHFVDPEPVPLGHLILTMRSLLGTRRPRAIYLPYPVARRLMAVLVRLLRLAPRIGIEARPPAEAIFLRNFYESQVMSTEKLQASSFLDPDPKADIFSELPGLIRYYLRRWENLNLIQPRDHAPDGTRERVEEFVSRPERLLAPVLAELDAPFLQRCPVEAPAGDDEAPSSRG